jgi:hypothetical protein
LKISFLEWDEENVEHIALHHISPEEVEAIFDQHFVVKKARNNRYIAYGRSFDGRYLFVVFRYLGHGRARVITARDMTDMEKSRFKRR